MAEAGAERAEILRTRDFLGWEVADRAGEKIGTVSDLLVDRGGRIRYLDVEFGLPRRHVLLPEHQLEWGERAFVVPRWPRDRVRGLPPYEPERPLTPPLLAELRRAFPWLHADDPEGWETTEPSAVSVVPLSEAKGFKLESGAPDLRGWNVFGADGERVGTVSGLLVDPAALKIRYLDVDVLDDLFLLSDDRHVLVPLEHVDLKERGNDVWVRRMTAAEVARFPAYAGEAVEPWLEEELDRTFAG